MEESYLIIILSTFLTSLLGSFHCSGMCAPILVVVAKDLPQWVLYHVGRLLGYVAIAWIAHSFGGALLSQLPHALVLKLGVIMMGVVLIAIGVLLFQGRNFHIQLPAVFQKPVQYFLSQSSFLVGFFTFTLPCGWLYAFVIGSATLPSAWLVLAVMTAFWAGTLPFLTIAPWLVNKFIRPMKEKHPKLISVFIILLGAVLILGQFRAEIEKRLTATQTVALDSACSLNAGECLSLEGQTEEYKISLSPLPLELNKPLKVRVEFTRPQSESTALELDVSGIDMDMGFNRPKLDRIDERHFEGAVILPTCSRAEMTWRLTLLLNGAKAQKLIPYNVLTKDK